MPIQVDDRSLSASTRSTVRSVIEEARDRWKQSIRAVLSFDTSTRWLSADQPYDASVCYLEIQFAAQISGKLGTVYMEPGSNRHVNKVTMRLALQSATNNRALTADELRAVALHEFGHAYGLYKFGPAEGHSSLAGSVMYPSSTWTTLAPGDEATIRDLYRLTPTEVRQDAGPPPEIVLYYASSYLYGISLELRGQRYEIQRSQSLRLRLGGAQDQLKIWECPSAGCRWTSFAVQAGTSYDIVDVAGGRLGLRVR